MVNRPSFDGQAATAHADQGTSRRRVSDAFNDSGFSRFLNSGAGRVFRVMAGFGFLAIGARLHDRALGVAALAWSVFPLSAGGLDLCYISAALGGPLSGAKIREAQRRHFGSLTVQNRGAGEGIRTLDVNRGKVTSAS